MVSRRVELSDVGRHLLVAGLWVAAFLLLSRYGARLVPVSLARNLSLQGYLTVLQLVTAALGIALSAVLLERPRDALGIASVPLPRALGLLLIGPAIYVVASYVAIYVALPTLLAEIAARGRQAVQESTGEFGRQLASSGLGLAIVWGVVVSPVAEELMFRGAVWSAVQSLVDFIRGRRTASDSAPSSADMPEGVIAPSATLYLASSVGAFFVTGGAATFASAGVFALMHADVPGGLGIVRWVSALGLGLATGFARHFGASLAAPILIHAAFNACALATTRRWLVTESFGQKLGVPILLSALAVGCLIAAAAVTFAFRARPGRAS